LRFTFTGFAAADAVISPQKRNKILLAFCALNLLYYIGLHHLLAGDDGLEPLFKLAGHGIADIIKIGKPPALPG
jgi:hypothetical protein